MAINNEDDFVEQILHPAFNDEDEIDTVDQSFGTGSAAGYVIDIGMTNGDRYQVSVVRRP